MHDAVLRQKYLYSLKNAERYEMLAKRLRAAIAAMEAAHPDIAKPKLRRQRNPIFAKGEMAQLMMRTLREAKKPLAMREIAARMLAKKGFAEPDQAALMYTWHRLSSMLANAHGKGEIVMEGTPNRWKWRLPAPEANRLAA